MTVTLGTYGNNGPGGWTTFVQSAGGRLIYVSTSGVDTNDGLTTSTPVQTLTHAWSLVTAGRDDWVLLKRGDTWTGEWFFIDKSGASANAPILISSYGTGAKPVISTLNCPINSNATIANFIAIVGLHLSQKAQRDPSVGGSVVGGAAGINLAYSFTWVLIEDVLVDWCNGVYPGSSVSAGGAQAQSGTLIFRRNVVQNSPGEPSGGCQGFICGNIANILFEENVLRRNGYNYTSYSSASAANFHQIYLEDDNSYCNFRGNILAGSQYNGLKSRNASDVTNNLIMQTAVMMDLYGINAGLPYGWYATPVSVANNVFMDGRALGPGDPTFGGGGWNLVAVDPLGPLPPSPLQCYNNIVANASVSSQWCICATGMKNGSVTNNAVYNWGLALVDNGTGNNTTSPANKVKLTEDGTNPHSWPNRFVTPGTYYASIGGTNNTDAFLDRCCLQSKDNWSPLYTAPAVNDYLRTGFALPLVGFDTGSTAVPTSRPRVRLR